jgi:hypothetical protein
VDEIKQHLPYVMMAAPSCYVSIVGIKLAQEQQKVERQKLGIGAIKPILSVQF